MKATIKNLKKRNLFRVFLNMKGSDPYKAHYWDENKVVNIPPKMLFKHFSEEDFTNDGMLKDIQKDFENEFEDIEISVSFTANSDGYVTDNHEYHYELPTLGFLSDILMNIPEGKYNLKISLEKIDVNE